MADARDIVDLVQARVKRILDFAELAVPADKFERFRTSSSTSLDMKDFGKIWLRFWTMAARAERKGMGRAGTSLAGKAVRLEWIGQSAPIG